ncbi:MAG: bacteriohemerythrin [Sinimarinibacterium sp.]|jgi:hemerythrin-like metal-binding protein
MPLVEWTPDFEVGSCAMDQQHQQLIEIVNRYRTALNRKAPRAELVTIFEEVADYARHHFREEEALMVGHAYPGLAAHRQTHRQLMDRVTELLLNLRAGEPAAARQIQSFLTHWLTAHILDTDVKYKPFVHRAA